MVAVGDPILLETTPGLLVGSATETTDSSTFTAETVIGTVTFSEVSGVTYELCCHAQISSSVANDVPVCRMRHTNLGGTVVTVNTEIVADVSPGRPILVALRALYTAASTGSKTFIVTAAREAGTGDLRRHAGSTFPQLFTVKVT